LALVGENLEKPIVGGTKAVGDLIKDAMDIDSGVKDLRIRLLSEDASDLNSVLDLARRANEIAARIREVSVFGGVPIARVA
jgi:hypothetical protein